MNRSILLVGGLLVVLLTAAWWFLLVSPVNERVTVADQQLDQAENEEGTLAAQRRSLQQVQDNMLEYLAAIGELENSIPPTPQAAALIDSLSVLAGETGVVWSNGSYGQPQDVDGAYFEIPISITINGQFFEVLGYLYGMAELDRLVQIESVSIAPTQSEQGFTVLNVSISAKAYTSSDVILPAAPEGEAPPEGGAGADQEGGGEPPVPDTQEGEPNAEGEDVAAQTGARL